MGFDNTLGKVPLGTVYVEARHATVKMLSLTYGRLDGRALRVGKPISSSARSQAFYSSIVCTSTLERTGNLFFLVLLWYVRYKEHHTLAVSYPV